MPISQFDRVTVARTTEPAAFSLRFVPADGQPPAD
jgi:hypothetical protein